MEILTNEDILNQSHDVKTLIRQWIINQISFPFVEIFYSIEKYFPFESLFVPDLNENIFSIFKKLISNHLNEALSKQTFNILNANQANNINVIFDLKLPFILKEFDVLKNRQDIKSSIHKIINLEKELKLDLNTESRDRAQEDSRETPIPPRSRKR